MKIGEYKKQLLGVLSGVSEGDLAAEILMCHVLGFDKKQLFLSGELEISTDHIKIITELAKRHLLGEPVAYLTGVKEFYGLEFKVSPDVLIPRPETEVLVDEVLSKAKENSQIKSMLDVGTGSGAIALAIAKKMPELNVFASDISSAALNVARENAEKLGVLQKVTFLESNLLNNIGVDLDLIVANLPYIGTEKFNLVSKETDQYEPHLALYAGSDGLCLYERLFEEINRLKFRPKYVLGEFGFMQAGEIGKLLDKYFGKLNWEIKKDLASIDRIFVVGLAA